MPRPHLKISVPQPCAENWAAMTPQGKGRFCAACAACATMVTDFSQFTDQELLVYFGGASGKVCGRFSPQQLQRPVYLESVSQPKYFFRAIAAVALFFGLASQTQAQKHQDHPTPSAVIQTSPNAVSEKMVGKTPEKVNVGKLVISGSIIDSQTNEPLAFCSVRIKGTEIFSLTDESGNYKLSLPDTFLLEKFTINTMYPDYKSLELPVSRKGLPSVLDLKMVMDTVTWGEAVCIHYTFDKPKPWELRQNFQILRWKTKKLLRKNEYDAAEE